MTLHRRTVWICLADGAHARILIRADKRLGLSVPYSIVTQFDSLDTHYPSRALAADRPGRTQESANAARHAIEPRTDFHRAGKAGFMRLLAHYLDEAGARADYDGLMIVAPVTCLRSLRAALQPATLAKVIATKARDLMKVPLAELTPHLPEEAIDCEATDRQADRTRF